jgi:OOP family OmpA-OmpF porin
VNKFNVSGAVLFPFGKSELLPPSKARLDDLAAALKSEPDQRIRLEGNTDNVGTAEFNQELSVSRANAVKDYLVEQGVAADRIDTEGFGKTQPVVENNTVDNRANNRRVEVRVEGEQAKPPEGEPAAPTPEK